MLALTGGRPIDERELVVIRLADGHVTSLGAGLAIGAVASGYLLQPLPNGLFATPFDVEGVRWSHRGDSCTFDTMLAEFGLRSPALDELALIVRGADTARMDLAPEAAGLLAASVGFSRMYKDDLAQLDAAMSLYDAFYRRLRDAADETHNWPAPQPAAKPVAKPAPV